MVRNCVFLYELYLIPSHHADFFNESEVLPFKAGDERRVYTMMIPQDDVCEGSMNITTQLSLYSGVHPMSVERSTAHVIIDDCDENECSKQ